LSDTVKSVAAI